MRRLFVPSESMQGSRAVVEGDAHRHLARVLRASRGDAVTLFDGQGNEVDARVVMVRARATELELGERRVLPRARAVRITLVQGLPRGDRMDLIVQKTTELGVDRIVPLVSSRSVPKPSAGSVNQRLRRWHAVAREACRVSGRADMPGIGEPVDLHEALAQVAPESLRLALWEESRGQSLRAALGDRVPHVTLLVGPEGGLSDEEAALAASAGFLIVGLGPRILRTETAAIVAVALAQAAAGGLD